MTAMSTSMDRSDWKRLGELVAARRNLLKMTQGQLAQASDVTQRTIVDIEGGVTRKRFPQSLYKVEPALLWQPGSMRRILEGGEPTPTPNAGRRVREAQAPGYQPQVRQPRLNPERMLWEEYSRVLRFADMCADYAAPPEAIEDLKRAAYVALSNVEIPETAPEEVDFDLAAYRPHAPTEGPSAADAKQIIEHLQRERNESESRGTGDSS